MELSYKDLNRVFDGVSINKERDRIRVTASVKQRYGSTDITFDYFELKDGIVTKCPRGFTKQYKGAKVINLDEFPPTTLFGREI